MNEPQGQTATMTATPTEKWGDAISEQRQRELQSYLDRWEAEADHSGRRGPFDAVSLTGADVGWLFERFCTESVAEFPGLVTDAPIGLRGDKLTNLHLEGALLEGVHMEGAVLNGVHMEHASLRRARLEGVQVRSAHLEGADLSEAHLQGADLRHANLKGARLNRAHVENARLDMAHLEGSILSDANLEGASLDNAELEQAELINSRLERVSLHRSHLRRANLLHVNLQDARILEADVRQSLLIGAHLEGANLSYANVEGACLTGVWLDSRTILERTAVDAFTQLGDIHWSGVGAVDLTSIAWDKVPTLGDERILAHSAATNEYERVVRAYRQLATQLRAQGMHEVADRFSYRAQLRQRGVLLRRWRIPQYLGSRFLDLISGYGYRPWRSFITYVLVILAFAAAYFSLGNANGSPLQWNEAIVISMTAFHGRGFFSAVFQPGDVQAAVAAAEAFIGLLIEIVFIATFTQRFFAR